MKFPRELRRNLQAYAGMPSPNRRGKLVHASDFADDPKSLGVDEGIDQLPALDGFVLVENNHRHVLDIIIESEPKRDHLDQRGKKHEEERKGVSQDDDEFLA